MHKPPLIIIGGATGVGKTSLSLKLAAEINGEIISADSMQVYRGFDIGTAKIKEQEKEGIPHHLIDILNADEPFSVFEFQKYTKAAIADIYSRGRIPIIVGGTGFYIQAVLNDIDFSLEDSDPERISELERLARDKGPEFLHNILADLDPEAAAAIHPNNVKKVIRAITFYEENGRKISEHNKEESQKTSPYNFAYFVLNRERQTIYERINTRVDKMMEEGLEAEVRGLLNQGISRELQSMQGLGYKEIAAYIFGETDLEGAVEQLKTGTRHFAKRQLTWFKREPQAIWLNYEDFENENEMLKEMINIIEKGEINC
ncbi:MAG: tRNA (adenosine(37)-N6)-dimethylallyltransferase MiaA, partial [Parasporobacterium sp.]|nr:tRNA (adenosine(37)-N6)-dimethylallyltransferase MiaA [Parasporobacterium sp.]